MATIEGGLNVFDETAGKFERIGPESGLTTNTVFAIEVDNEAFLWLATNNGVFQFDPGTRRVVARYGRDDALPSDVLLSWPGGMLMTSKQELMLGTLSGLGVISLPSLQSRGERPRAILTSLKRDGIDLPRQSAIERVKKLDLHWPGNAFEFEASIIGHAGHARQVIRYKLDGHDENWFVAGSAHQGRYSRIPGGTYSFFLQGRVGDGPWSESTMLAVTVHPAFWQELWFQSVVVIFVLGSLIGFVSWRLSMARRLLASARALQRSEDRFRDVAEAATDWFWETDEQHRLSYLSARFAEVTGLGEQEALGKTRWELAGQGQDDGRWPDHRETLEAHQPFRDFRYRSGEIDGRTLEFLISGKPLFDAQDRFRGYRGTGSDVTAEVESAEEARDAREQFLDAIENVSEGFALWDAEDRLVVCNSHYRALSGPAAEFPPPGTTFEAFLNHYIAGGKVPEAVGREEAWLQERLARHRNPSGAYEAIRSGRWFQVREQRLADGRTIVVTSDIHDLKQREEQLRQSQKMESVGQLTAGIAHDFNNLLTTILNSLDMIQAASPSDSSSSDLASRAIRAGERAANLTGRLLAFARKQVLEPQIIDLNGVITGMDELLRRSLGEHIEIELVTTGGLWLCEVDPSGIESALLNLAINARDAMPEGGRLTIETANARLDDDYAAAQVDLRPGQYVRLAVSDTGTGMPPEISDRVFDPFFTTKEIGHGSGLGLSMVHGFMKQSDGHIAVYSEEGEGTTFRLYLPRSHTAESRAGLDPATNEAPPGLGETVLVVEDDEMVREMTASLLESLGYRISTVATATEALETLRSAGEFDLLLTDAILPGGMSGADLVREVARLFPATKVLYMSGFTGNAIVHHGRLDPGVLLLRKPFRRSDLARKVREALEKDIS